MEVTKTTTEATLSAIHESLAQLSVTLGRMAATQEDMLVVSKKMTTALAPIATTTPMFVPGQHTTKPSSSSIFSAVQVMGAGGPHAGAVYTSATPTRCSTKSLGNDTDCGHAKLAFSASDTTQLLATTSSGDGNCTLQGVGGAGMTTPVGCSTHVLTGSAAGARAANNNLRSSSFPRFDGTNPGLWRTQCLEYFNSFNIHKCMWVIAAKMHMEGKAKVWYEAYRLRQVVGAWPEFIDDVEAHFGVRDLPPSTTMLGAAHPSGGVHSSGDISPKTPNSCLPVSPKEVMVTAAEPTLVELAESIQLQFAELKLALATEYDERKKAHVTQIAEPTADYSNEMLTHVNGVSLFLELWEEPAQMVYSDTTLIEVADDVFTCIGGSSLFLELDLNSANKVFEADVLTTVGGASLFLELDMESEVLTCIGDCSIFLEPSMGNPTEVFAAPSNVDMDKFFDPGGSRFPCWVLHNKKFAANITVSFLNQLIHLHVWENGKSATFAMELYVQWDPGIIENVLMAAMSAQLAQKLVEMHVLYTNVLMHRPTELKMGISPGISPDILDVHLLGILQLFASCVMGSALRQPVLLFESVTDGVDYNIFQLILTHGDVKVAQNMQLLTDIGQFRFSPRLKMLFDCSSIGGQNGSVYELLGQNLSLTEDKKMHMIGAVGPINDLNCGISVMTATSVRVNASMDMFEISGEDSVLILDHEQNTNVLVVLPEHLLPLQRPQGHDLLIVHELQDVYWIATMPVEPCVKVLDVHVQRDPSGFLSTMNGEQEPNHTERSWRMHVIAARGYKVIIGLDDLSAPWDPGIVSIYASAVPVCVKARRPQCRSGSYTLL